ncbi:MAG: SusC/RagA family protein, partial [Bacteroidales bacterium]
FTSMWANKGEIENKGLEISLDFGVVSQKNFNLNIGGNISFNRNVILDAGVQKDTWGSEYIEAFPGSKVINSGYLQTYANIFIQGKPMGLFYGFKTNGIIQEGNNDNPPTYNNIPGTNSYGDIFYVDQNGDGTMTEADRVVIGNPNPKFTGGFYITSNYKSLSLSVNFTGVYGNEILNANLLPENEAMNGNSNNIRSDAYFKAWREGMTDATYPGLNRGNQNSTYPTDRLIEDGSFLRLSNVSLSYKFNTSKISWLGGASVSASARNLFCLTNYSGWDPEVDSFTNDPMRMSIDWGSFPNSRSFTFGVNLTF